MPWWMPSCDGVGLYCFSTLRFVDGALLHTGSRVRPRAAVPATQVAAVSAYLQGRAERGRSSAVRHYFHGVTR